MECIICQDDNSEYLQDNTSCDCKYKVHASCWIDYVHSKTNVTCLICRKERIEYKKEIPSAPPLPAIIEEQEHHSHNTVNAGQTAGTAGGLRQTAGGLRQSRVITNREMNTKIIKIATCLVILVLVLVLIWA